MSLSSLALSERRSGVLARFGDYFELTKPKIAALVLATVAVSACAASPGGLDLLVLLHTVAGTALVAASASALNQWLERETDALMPRTAARPLPSGRLGSAEALVFAAATGLAGSLWLALLVNPLTALLAAATWTLYVWVYTPLKSRTWLNTAVGAAPGALPVLIGWASAAALDARAAVLFGIVYLWQFPHFMAIAWLYRREYAQAGLKMLPVLDESGRRTAFQAVACALALLPAGALAGALFFEHWGWIAGLAAAGAAQAAFAWRFAARRDKPSARRLLRASLVYLPVVLTLLLVGSVV
jgi:protoheme IX farnesyltransferase